MQPILKDNDDIFYIIQDGVKVGEMGYINFAKNVSITFNILEQGGIDIIDSYEIKNDIDKLEFLEFQRQFGIDFGKRSNNSLLIEWKAHNILYNKGLFKKRTKDTGLNPKESWIRRLFYRCVCFIFTER